MIVKKDHSEIFGGLLNFLARRLPGFRYRARNVCSD